jgi:6-phosphogluconolactonase (cycloisomerase 2 family)
MKPMIRTLLVILAFTAGLSAVEARIDQPSHIFYGNATLYGAEVEEGTSIEARLTASGESVGRYAMGRDPKLGGQYALPVAMDDVEPRQAGHARPGDEVQVFIGGQLAAETTVGAIGKAVRLDIDPQLVEGGPNISITDTELYEGNAGEQTQAELTITIDDTEDSNLDIGWSTENGSAIGGPDCSDGADFVHVDDGVVTIPAGSQQQTLSVTVCGDDEIEEDESFTVELTATPGAFDKQTGTITILDDDNLPEIEVANAWIEEPQSGSDEAVFAVTLSRNHDETVTLDWQTEDLTANAPGDYVADQGALTLEPGEISGEIRVQVNADAEVEPQEAFAVRLDNATQARLTRSTATGIIADPEFDPALRHEGDAINDEDGIVGIADPTAVAISPNGHHVYVTSESTNQITAFLRHGRTGELTLIDAFNAQLEGFEEMVMDAPIDVAVSDDGRFVYVAAMESDAITVFERNESDGRLVFVENQIHAAEPDRGLEEVRRIALSPDGEHLYASGRNSVAVFARDSDTGELAFLEAEINGSDDPDDAGGIVAALERPLGLQVTPAGDQLLVTSRLGDALLVFDRNNDPDNSEFGQLSFVEALRNNKNGIEGLNGATDVQISADGGQVYVTAEASNSMVNFARGGDGALEQERIWTSGETELPGMAGAQHLALAPDNTELFVSGFADSSLTLFRRQSGAEGTPENGRLSVKETYFDDQGRTQYLGGATDIAITGNNLHVYVVANRDNAIVIFTRISAEDLFDDGFGD